MLDFRDSGQEKEIMVFMKIPIRKCFGFEALDECSISDIDSGQEKEIMVFMKIPIRKCYGFEALDECWISAILLRR